MDIGFSMLISTWLQQLQDLHECGFVLPQRSVLSVPVVGWYKQCNMLAPRTWTQTVWKSTFILVVMSLLPWTSEGLELGNCKGALGMQNGKIIDSAISASSSFDEGSVGPQNARIRTEKYGGAWCPKRQIKSDVYEYLQVDLGPGLHVLTMTETQGRFGNGQGQEYAEQYLLEYQREEYGTWIRFHDRRGQEIIKGNRNTYIAELRNIDPPIIARRIRFIPYSSHPRTVCMRIELYGCRWKDAIMSYDMPEGERRGTEVDLYDFTYDGKVENGFLSGGLGQLTDGQEGQTNFRLDPQGLGYKGYEWVGWKNDSVGKGPVEIVFRFENIRNFTSLRLHCNNMFNKDVRVFQRALIFFSIGGKYYTSTPIEYKYMRDTLIEFARLVTIPLFQKVGKFVKLQLYYDARWILISEIQFNSEPASSAVNFTEEVAPPSTAATSPTNNPSTRNVHDPLQDNFTKSRQGYYPSQTTSVSVLNDTRQKSLDDEYIGIIIGALTALILLLFIIVFIIVWRHRRYKQNSSHRITTTIEPGHVTLNLNDLRTMNGKLSNGNMYNSVPTSEADSEGPSTKMNNDVYMENADTIQTRRLPDLPKTPESTDTNTSREYAVPDITKTALIVNIPPQPQYSQNSYRRDAALQPGLSHPHDPLYAANDIISNLNIQGVSGNTVYAAPNMDSLWKEDLSVMEFPRENLKFIEQLGEGQFGEVHLCEALKITDFLGDDFLINRTSSKSMLVAVKMLQRDADDNARNDFQKEVKIMSRLKDPNIVRVLGVCTVDDPLCVIVEYMKYGDLHQHLQQHFPENTVSRSKKQKTLSYGGLIYVASQVASGMKYLENLNMVHRDLATRNCLVGHNYTIKISDFGMSRSLYSADYYRIEGRAVLPIRWMAWESILLGKFTTKSDVWSFAVTLWEILNYCRVHPYENLSDETVIENCGHFYRNDGLEEYLPQPDHCPREIYDLMKECWNRNELNRPAFKEIHMFLQRKNMGYNPRDEKVYQNKMSVPVV